MDIANPWGLLFAAADLFCIAGAILNWDWFMESRKAELLVKMLGRNGARVFYFILGAVLVFLGAGLALGILKDAAQ